MAGIGRASGERFELTRRQVLRVTAALAGGGAIAKPRALLAQEATPAARWSSTDVVGNTFALPRPPRRIATAINTAAALWDFGVETPVVFGWTASNHPDGDHVAWGNIAVDVVEIVHGGEGNLELGRC